MKKSKDRCPERTKERRGELAEVRDSREETPDVEAGPDSLDQSNLPAADTAEVAARQLASACAACESPESIAAYQELWKELNFIGTLDGHDVAFPEGSAKKVLPGKVYALFLELRSYAKHESPLYGSFRKVYGVFWVEGLSYSRAEFLDAYPLERIRRVIAEAERRSAALFHFFRSRWEDQDSRRGNRNLATVDDVGIATEMSDAALGPTAVHGSEPSGNPTSHVAPEAVTAFSRDIAPESGREADSEDYVTLDQMAALVKRSKRTLEKHLYRRVRPIPPPDIEGGGGKAHQWRWNRVRPWLQAEYARRLPETYPGLGRG